MEEKRTVRLPECGHDMCRRCMLQWLEACRIDSTPETCPVCRASVADKNELIFKNDKATVTVKRTGVMEWAHDGVVHHREKLLNLEKATTNIQAFWEGTPGPERWVYMGDPLREAHWPFAMIRREHVKTLLVFGLYLQRRTVRQRAVMDTLLQDSTLFVYTRHGEPESIYESYRKMLSSK